MARELHDHYFREAKREGFRSRAAYKLIEIDDRKHVLRPGDWVLDCGCAPGSWLQVAVKRVGRRGIVVGVDLTPIGHRLNEPNVHVITADLCELDGPRLRAAVGPSLSESTRRFDVILSDMAPKTTGDRTMDHHGSMRLCEAVLDLSESVLAGGGKLVMKALEGEAYPQLLQQLRAAFSRVKGFKPKASRSDSTEMYVIAEGFRVGARSSKGPGQRKEDDATAVPPPPRRPPAPGWSSR